jgi:hypothetical protein
MERKKLKEQMMGKMTTKAGKVDRQKEGELGKRED